MNQAPNFVVWCPMPFNEASGGNIALHKLAHNLATLGERAFILTEEKNPRYLGQEISAEQFRELDPEITLVIYPEIVLGNPLQGKQVVRWLLNTPGVMTETHGEGEDGETDTVYKYAAGFRAKDESKVKGELRALELNLELFKNRGGPRQGCCHLIRKARTGNGIHPIPSALMATSFAGENQYLADVLNQCQTTDQL